MIIKESLRNLIFLMTLKNTNIMVYTGRQSILSQEKYVCDSLKENYHTNTTFLRIQRVATGPDLISAYKRGGLRVFFLTQVSPGKNISCS